MYQSIPAVPNPPAIVEHLPTLTVPGVGHLQIFCCPGAGHLPTPGAIPELLTHTRFPIRIHNYTEDFTGKDWLICQGQEKLVEGCKCMFLILCMHFFIAYQARIT